MKIVTIVGARPQFIKAATVSRALARHGAEEVLVHTGQHYDADMSDVFFEQMRIPAPDYNLGVGGGRHGAMTGRQLEKIEEVLLAEKPDRVLVYGDTNSTLAGALAAAKLHVPLAHVEAGLRSFNRRMPEEVNRVVTDHVADLLFAPTRAAMDNLIAEGIIGDSIRIVGDVMYDAALFYAAMANAPSWFHETGLREGEFVLSTIHRAENTESAARLEAIFEGLSASRMPVILPLHPRTRARMVEFGIDAGPMVRIVNPVGYLEMAWLEANCRVIATDSGGVQKEAYFHRKPCVVLRDETEWVELVASGCNSLAGVDPGRIAAAIRRDPGTLDFSARFYGEGNASELVADQLVAEAARETPGVIREGHAA